jgi:hypothetical protein
LFFGLALGGLLRTAHFRLGLTARLFLGLLLRHLVCTTGLLFGLALGLLLRTAHFRLRLTARLFLGLLLRHLLHTTGLLFGLALGLLLCTAHFRLRLTARFLLRLLQGLLIGRYSRLLVRLPLCHCLRLSHVCLGTLLDRHSLSLTLRHLLPLAHLLVFPTLLHLLRLAGVFLTTPLCFSLLPHFVALLPQRGHLPGLTVGVSFAFLCRR